MLETRRKVTFVLLCGTLVFSGVLEMGGMMVLFGFVAGLNVDAATGRRHGHLAHALEKAVGHTLAPLDFVLLGGAVVLAFMAFKNLQSTAARFAISRMLMKVNQRISEGLYRAYMLAPYELFVQSGFGAPSKEIGKIFNLFNACFSATVQLLADSSILLMVWVLLLFVDPQLTLLSTSLFAAVGIGLYWGLQRVLGRMGEQQDDADKRVNQFLNEGMQGVVEVRLRGSRNYYFQSYGAALGRTAVLRRRKAAMARLPRSANELALGALIVGATLYVTLRHETVAAALPTLGVFGFAGIRMNGVMSRVNVAAQILKRKLTQFEDAYQVLVDVAPHIVGRPTKAGDDYLKDEQPLPEGVDGRMHEALTLRGVSFTYPGAMKSVVRDVTMTIRRGEFISVCGPSGSGKSTLLLLIMGLVKPNKGEIVCDQWPISRHIQAWHSNIGYVSQASLIVGRSIRDNVAFGVDPLDVDDAKVWRALELASAAEFVRELPGQLDAGLHDGGLNLSGGQRQRLIIARALYDDPEVLILDEATAALDNITERDVTEAITKLSGRKTIICVAHRLSTIRHSDRIYFLRHWRIQAQGSYDELLENDEDFAEMVRAGEGTSLLGSRSDRFGAREVEARLDDAEEDT